MKILEASRVHKVFENGGKSLPVLKGVDIAIEQGSFVSLVGPSGAGKSTLLHILGGLDEPSTGKVFFNGRDIYGMDPGKLAALRNKSIGFVFQFYYLLPEFTLLENVMMPSLISSGSWQRKAGIEERARQLLTQVGLADRLTHFPLELSGGERQRAAIVRALMNSPELLLCDEPTGNLDSKVGSEIIALIRDLSQKNRMTVVLVTHNRELALASQSIYYLKDGVLAG